MRKRIILTGMILLLFSLSGCSDHGEVQHVDLTRQLEESLQESREREAKEKAEQEAKEKAEREAKEKAEREAKERAEWEAKEQARQEAKAKERQEEKERQEQEGKERKDGVKRDRELGNLLVGVWHSEPLDVSDVVLEGMKSAGKLEPFLQFDDSKLKLHAYFSFSKDGKAMFYLDYASYQQLMDYITEEVSAGAIRYFESKIQGLGIQISVESYLKRLGISLEDYVTDVISQYTQDFQPSQKHERNYQVLDGKLFMAENLEELRNAKDYFEFEVTEESLCMLAYYEDGQPNGKVMGREVTLPIWFYHLE